MTPSRWQTLRWGGPALAGLAAVTLVALVLDEIFYSVAAAGWLYLLVVLPVTLRWGRRRGIITALVAGVLLYGLLIEPHYSPRVQDPLDIVRLAISIGGMVLAVILVDYANRGRVEAERRLAMHAEREAAQRRLAFVADASALLASSLDYETTLANVARLTVPHLTDLCVVDVVDESGTIRRVEAVHADPNKAELARSLRNYPPDPTNPKHPITRALISGRSEYLPNLPDSLLEEMARDPEHRALLHELRLRRLLVLPLVAHGRTLGAISFEATAEGRVYGPEDITLAEDLARRAALAVDNARLYHEAQQAIRVRDDFLAATSHELRTPLSHIKGFVSTLRQSDVQWSDETRDDFLAEIERETDRLAKMIGDLLDMSRIESGGLDASERTLTRPSDVVTGGLDRVRGLLECRTVEVDVSEALPALPVDVSQMERVIANLVENAAKYSVSHGLIRIAGASVNGSVELRVEDEGPGVPEEHLEQIFDKFFRIPNAARFGIPGTGLGLSICRAIVQAHGGHIWAENTPTGGACFVVRLPITLERPGSAW
jgi:K+-sensing histidine kinase KdpD